MSTTLRALLLALVFTVLPVGVGVAMTGGSEPVAAPSYRSTALADFDATHVSIARSAFCDRIPAEAISDALGAEPRAGDAYRDGERRPMTPTGPAMAHDGKPHGEVLHEFGCTFKAGRAVARAWVFAPPVTDARAGDLASRTKGCSVPHDAGTFGAPGSVSVCARSAARTATYAGLFGDAWLSCSVTLPKDAGDQAGLLDRAGRWCVAVARAAAA